MTIQSTIPSQIGFSVSCSRPDRFAIVRSFNWRAVFIVSNGNRFRFWCGALTELLGGIALVLGIFVKPAAYLLAFVMFIALWRVKGFAIFSKGEIDFALLGATLAIAMMGSGKFGVAHRACGCCKDGVCSAEKADEMKKA